MITTCYVTDSDLSLISSYPEENVRRDSSVGIATRYEFDDRGIETRW